MNEEILNDEKVVKELHDKIGEYAAKVKGYEEKKNELRNTLSDLNKKTSIDGISDSTKEKIEEVAAKVKEKINEIDSQTEDLNNKIREINETLNPKPETPEMPVFPEPPKSPFVSEIDNRIRELENRRSALETKRSGKETERSALETQRSYNESARHGDSHNDDDFNAKIAAQIGLLEEQKRRVGETVASIEEKMDDENINEATRERLEEMRDEVQEKIDEIDEKIEELQDKKDEHWDEIIDSLEEKIDEKNDEIDEINDEIDEINDEIDEMNETVDENIINEVRKSTGFDGISSLINSITDSVNSALKSVNIPDIKIPEINIPKLNIKIPAQNYSPDKTRSDAKYNVNFCSHEMGARISSVCCQHSGAEQAANLLRNDPNYHEKWCAADWHGESKIVHPHWAIVDFGEIKTFNYLKLIKCSTGQSHASDVGCKSFDASAWRFEVSVDKKNWVEFNRETDDQSAVYEKNLGNLTGRYVRLFIDACGSDPNNKYERVRLHELCIEMRGENGESINLCKGAAIESCCFGDWGSVVPHLINEDIKTKWYVERVHEEKRPNSHWVIIDLGEMRTFNHFKIAKASVGKHDFGHKEKDMSAWCAEVSGDMTNWKAFNYETNDHSAIYEKIFDPRTGRYIRLWVDAGASNPDNKYADVIIYDLRVDMIDRKEENREEITFEDIAAIAPFAKKETLDKLVDKLIATNDFDLNKIKSLAPFLSKETLNKLILKVSDKADINTIRALAPFLDRETLDRLVDELNEDMDFEKIRSLAPFLSKEALAKCVTRGGDKLDMKRLRSLAPFLGSDYIDEIISKML